ncbi:aminoglycoside phosphotransferase family protein [Saccharopolyspora rosea]|uniref:aminoglycoside phosphotransferase family protein n=1 Tax=Saccharopolyspora rosea TaxID=524884 RepID=UPI0021D8C009|nr:aminoglycoside phosphotransferase family protein [Saccharopolyspora rosea]
MTGDRFDEVWRAALAAATRLGAELGLPTGERRVLSNRGNLVVHLAPAPVVVRVATLTAWTRREPRAWLEREVAVARYVADRGGPVVPPSSLVDPGPHRRDGFALSLWTYLPAAQRRADPVAAGEALAVLHGELVGCPRELPLLSPVREQIGDGLAALERAEVLDRERLAALRARHERVLADLAQVDGPVVALHGDAHPGNLLGVGAGWWWTDLEETCRGPREWDLAVLAGACGADGGAALRAYASAAGVPVPTADALAPFVRARELEAVVWALGMAHQCPARYRAAARALLEDVLGGRAST